MVSVEGGIKMGKLLKYELRKSLGVKGVVLVISCIFELLFLIGLYSSKETLIPIGITLLYFDAFISVVVMGIASIRLLHNDLNTKQSYMLFMTPNSSYKILGAKVIESFMSILIAGVFFTSLGFLDFTLLIAQNGGFKEAFDFIYTTYQKIFEIEINPSDVISVIALLLISWFYFITVAYLAQVISATFLNGRKFNGIISFFIGLAIIILEEYAVNNFVSISATGSVINHNILQGVVYLTLAGITYAVTAWIMDNKLSV